MTNQIKELKTEIERLKKENEIKTGWVSLLSHDFKENLGSLLWLIEAVENQTINKEAFFKLLPRVKQDTKKNLQTIANTGDWLKAQQDDFKPQLSKLFALELFLELRKEFDKKLTVKKLDFQFEGDENLCFQTDRFLIVFILKKILDNAIKYSHSGKTINFQVCRENNQVALSITDFGVGIKAEQLDSLFSFPRVVFNGTNGEVGAGLSLKIVKNFVYLMQGKIEVHSEENAETKISIFLPEIKK